MTQIYESGCNTCEPINVTNASNRISKLFEKLFKRIFDKDIKSGTIDADAYFEQAQEFEKALDEDLKIDFDKVDYDSPDLVMRNHLKRNLFSFSGAKTYSQFEEMRDALLDEDGNVRKFSAFKKKAQEINERYNVNWLKTEYNHAIASSQSAANWARAQRNKDIYPYFEYRTAGDSRVRSSHQSMNGIVKPIDDRFWDTNFPPNDWGCRCRADQVSGRGKEVTGDEEAKNRSKGATPNKLFKNNPGKNKVVFEKEHPYFKTAPNELKAVEHYGLQELAKIISKRKNLSGRDAFKPLKAEDTTLINKQVGYKTRLTKKQIEDSSISQHAAAAIKNPDEVWSQSDKIIFIKYYQGEAMEVICKLTDKGVTVDSWSFNSPDKIKSRKGILEKIKR